MPVTGQEWHDAFFFWLNALIYVLCTQSSCKGVGKSDSASVYCCANLGLSAEANTGKRRIMDVWLP